MLAAIAALLFHLVGYLPDTVSQWAAAPRHLFSSWPAVGQSRGRWTRELAEHRYSHRTAESFFAGIVRGVSSGLADTSLQLWLAMAQSPAERQRIEHHLTAQHVDGVLLLSMHDDDPLPGLLAERGLPAVLGGRPARMLAPGAQLGSFVDVDNAGCARLAVDHLAGAGRQRIATIAGPQDMGAGVARVSCCARTIDEAPPSNSNIARLRHF